MNISSINSLRAMPRFGDNQTEKKLLKSRHTKEEWENLTKEEQDAWVAREIAENSYDGSNDTR